MFTKSAVAAALVVFAAPAMAQVSGGTLGIEYSLPTDGGDLGGTTYSGALEYSINRQFSVAADLAGYRLDNISTDASSFTLHGIYHLDDATAFGAFFGADQLSGSDAQNVYGVEGGTAIAGAEVQAYLGLFDGVSEDATLFGADGSYDFGNGIAAIASLNIATGDTIDITRTAIGAEYTLASGPAFYAELGTVSAEGFDGVDADDTFIGLGARLDFGGNSGTTFGQRSLFEILPGF